MEVALSSSILQVPATAATTSHIKTDCPEPKSNDSNCYKRDKHGHIPVSAQRVMEEETPTNVTHVGKRGIHCVIVLVVSSMVFTVVAVKLLPTSGAATMITEIMAGY